jgi:predicted NAD-dependent protein-ADP-ribosyltransferase YbiA (DUF1768 family)
MKFNKTSKYSKRQKSFTTTKKIRDSVCSYSKKKSRLYTNSVVFQFYSKSKDNELPGKSSGEKITQSCISKYSELSTIPNWRKMLSNFWEPPGNESKTKALFSLGGHKWRTLQNYLQGIRYIDENHKYYLQFSLDSNSQLSKSPILAKKMYKHIKCDDNYEERKTIELERGLYAKFSQNIYLRNMLLNTLDAKLVHFRRGKPPLLCIELMKVRQRLRNELCNNVNKTEKCK